MQNGQKGLRSGFSFIRNGQKLGYPYLEAIRSLAPLVDELVVAVGDNEDNTREQLEKLRDALPCELVLFDSPWDMSNTKGGLELSRQSNIALSKCKHEICIYIQGDELLHEEDYSIFKDDLNRFENDDEVEALAFAWVHFYGNFETIAQSRQWYRREIRAIKKSSGLQSYGDAQGFRKPSDSGMWSKPRAALSKARYLHYGWVRPPKVMAAKSEALDRLWHGSDKDGQHKEETVYPKIFGLQPFQGSHPKIMQERIAQYGSFDPFEGKQIKKDFAYYRLLIDSYVERFTGWRPGEYTNFSSLKRY
jgi:hypothetical protein